MSSFSWIPPVQTVLRLVRVPLYGAESTLVTGRETRKRPSGAGFQRPVREGRKWLGSNGAEKVPAGSQFGASACELLCRRRRSGRGPQESTRGRRPFRGEP